MNSFLRIFLISLALLPGHLIAQTLHWNKGRGYIPFNHITSEGILLSNSSDLPLLDSVALPSGHSSARLRFRVDNRHAASRRSFRYTDANGKEYSRKNPPWAIFLTDAGGDTCWITITKNEAPDNDLAADTSGPAITVSFDSLSSRHDMEEKYLPFSGESIWSIEISDGTMRIVAGASQPTEVATIPLNLSGISSFGFASSPGGEILISDISFSRLVPDIFTAPSIASSDKEHEPDPIEGTYEIFDRTFDESLLKLGGEYKLAVAKNHDRYDIVYISGARINGNRWKTGMLKGILTPTSFAGIYNLEWFDAEGESLSHSITAQSGYGGTLTLQFPYHSSTIRLRKTN